MTYWTIAVELPGNPIPLELCRVLSVDALTAIVGALAMGEETRPITIRQFAVPDDPAPQPPF